MSRQVTDITRQKNSAFTPGQPLAGSDDFRDSRRGLIEEVRDLQVRNAEGRVVWDMASYCAFLTPEAPCPDSVNPSLWRHEQLTSTAGLFEVCDGIWQVRGYDISNMTIIRSDTGYIIIDALTCVETAKAAIELFFRHFERKPVRGFVVTHSHADHFGGIAGVVDPSEIRSGRVRMVVPKKFMEESVSENIFVGSAMKRRALYQFGNQLVPGPMTNVGAGLGKATSTGFTCLIQPTDEIERTGQTLTIDGVDFVFQM
ncbi:MAG: MBL fold metallo-hydrolase, partial [Desulfovibrionaceae bacterium]|nr:MBL fold metallo-hydrolase [Desulfovibrionaceae bacterium]